MSLSNAGQKALMQQLLDEEGFKQFPYKDTMGVWTVGIGRNLDANGITLDEAEYMLENDIAKFYTQLQLSWPLFNNVSENVKKVLIDMAFNLGTHGVLGFKSMLTAVENGDYAAAAAHMLDSLWAKQVPNRAKKLSEMMKNG